MRSTGIIAIGSLPHIINAAPQHDRPDSGRICSVLQEPPLPRPGPTDNLSRQPSPVDKRWHLDFQGRYPAVVFLSSAELAVVAPEHPSGFLKLVRALIAR